MAQIETLKCEKCGGEMKKSREAASTGAGCLLLLLGLVLLFFFPIGTIFGVIFLICGVIYGSKSHFLWVCKNCDYKFERKGSFWTLKG